MNSTIKSDIDVPSIAPEELYAKIQDAHSFTILDVRSESVAEDWKLDFTDIQTINYPYFELLEKLPEELEQQLPEDQEILVICTKGESSKMITQKLQENGYNGVALEEGTQGWSKVHKRKELLTTPELDVHQYIRPSSGCLSYILYSEDEAVVIDPLKQFTDTYIKDVQENNATIKYVIDTHIHADHISGFSTLAEQTDATKIMYQNSKERGVQYSFNTVTDSEQIQFGSKTLKAFTTPGHTTDMTSYYIDNILFTGDSLFLSSIARPDLEDPDKAQDMADDLYQSLQKILSLSEETIIAPAHKFTDIPTDTFNNTFTETLQYVDTQIGASEYTKEEFIEEITKDVPPRPNNYSKIIPVNKGERQVSTDKEYELEMGPNNCSAS